MTSRVAAVLACSLLATIVLAQPPAAEQTAGDAKSEDLVRHVVLFKFKADASAAKVAEIEKAFAALKDQIEQVVDLEWGTDNSPEGLARGFTHCFLLTFHSPDDRDAYLVHEAHKKFVDLLRPHLDEALVLDYTPVE